MHSLITHSGLAQIRCHIRLTVGQTTSTPSHAQIYTPEFLHPHRQPLRVKTAIPTELTIGSQQLAKHSLVNSPLYFHPILQTNIPPAGPTARQSWLATSPSTSLPTSSRRPDGESMRLGRLISASPAPPQSPRANVNKMQAGLVCSDSPGFRCLPAHLLRMPQYSVLAAPSNLARPRVGTVVICPISPLRLAL